MLNNKGLNNKVPLETTYPKLSPFHSTLGKSQGRSGSYAPAGASGDQPGVVGEDDRLDAVAEAAVPRTTPARSGLELGGAQSVDLQVQVVVLVGLADPLHSQPFGGGDRALVVWAGDRKDLVELGVVERPPQQFPARLFRITLAQAVGFNCQPSSRSSSYGGSRRINRPPTTSPSSFRANAQRPAGSTKFGWASIQACRICFMVVSSPTLSIAGDNHCATSAEP